MPADHTDCPVCRATGTDPCTALDYRALPTHHAERVVQATETTPLADASDPAVQAAEARSLLTRLATDMALVVRVDRYTVEVEGHRVRATPDQETRIAAMTAEERGRFLTVMGARRG